MELTVNTPSQPFAATRSVTKAARLETGATVRVPLFVKQGEKIRVVPESRKFTGRM